MYDLSCMLRLVGSMRLGNKRTFIDSDDNVAQARL